MKYKILFFFSYYFFLGNFKINFSFEKVIIRSFIKLIKLFLNNKTKMIQQHRKLGPRNIETVNT